MSIVLPVIGGLGLFLYGMDLMGSGLQKAAGNKLKKLIEVLTKNRIIGLLVGTVVTMVIQSSSATTVMVIGFVNAGLMSLTQAVGVIMGANIGTTITAQLIAFKLTDYAPLAIGIGVAIWLGSSKKKMKDLAEIILGFGILFIGMDMMGNGLKPLGEMKAFSDLMINLENPILGMLVGIGLTTLVQSSSASIGVLQALAGQNLIGINIGLPILFGTNIGTTTTALISSVGANKTAKRAAVIHFLFNFIGTIIFIPFMGIIQDIVLEMSPGDISRQIANGHTLFNLANVIIQLPFAGLLVKAAQRLVPGQDIVDGHEAKYLDYRIMETPAIALGQAKKEIARMGNLVTDNLQRARAAFVEGKYDIIELALDEEQRINKIQIEISDYLVKLSNEPLTDAEHRRLNAFFNCINDIERVGDHAENILELAQEKRDNNLSFTEEAVGELMEIFDKCEEGFKKVIDGFVSVSEELAKEVLDIEDQVDLLETTQRKNHINRLNKGTCSTGPGIVFLDAISNLERVSDHSANIAQHIIDEVHHRK